jgi:hypothetical protein
LYSPAESPAMEGGGISTVYGEEGRAARRVPPPAPAPAGASACARECVAAAAPQTLPATLMPSHAAAVRCPPPAL